MSNRNERSSSFLLILFLFIAAGALFYLSSRPSKNIEAEKRIFATSDEVEVIVNRHLQETHQAIAKEQLARKLENNFTAPQVGKTLSFQTQERSKALSIDMPEDREQEALRGDFATEKEVDYTSPNGNIQRELADKQNQKEYVRRYKEAYIRQFVENAKRHGWKVEIDKNGIIKKAEQFELAPEYENLMEPSAHSTQ